MNRQQSYENDQALIERYAEQPSRLPELVYARVLGLNRGEGPELYAMIDLGPDMRFREGWLVLTRRELLYFSGADELSPIRILRKDITEAKVLGGLSANILLIIGEPGSKSLLELRYSKRQKRAVENIRFVLEQQQEGNDVHPDNPDEVYAESVSGQIKDAQSSISGSHFQVIARLLSYFGPYKRQVAMGFAAALAMTVLNLIPPYLTGVIVDKILAPLEDGSMSQDTAGQLALVVVGGLALTYVLRELCVFIRLRKLAYIGEYVAHDLRQDLYQHLQKLSLRFYSKKQTGSIISRVSSDTDRLWDFIAFGVVEAVLCSVLLLGLGVVLISMDWQLGLLLVLPLPLFFYAFYRHGKSMNRHFLRAWRKWSDLTAVLSDTIPGMRVVKAFSQEKREVKRFQQRNDRALDCFQDVHDIWTRFWPMLMLGFHIVVIAVWALALPRVVGSWGEPLSTGTFVAFLMYMGMFFYPLEVIGQVTRMLNRAASSAHRVFEIMDTQPDESLLGELPSVASVQGHIRFENVSFSYDGVREILRNISFEIRPGEMIGLVGPSGAGKSTVTNLVSGFYRATDGAVTVDDRNLSELDMGSYRRHLGMVLQEPFLFHGTILENIRYGKHNAELDEIVEAARAANAHDYICKLPLGYDTIVGERGHTLSGGERQRLSIARAILHDPAILILDEATSNVDTETERKIQEALNRLVEGRTVIAIAHRLSTLKQADRLLVMKDGRLVEEGTHQQLLELPEGVYRNLHTMQSELHEQYAL